MTSWVVVVGSCDIDEVCVNDKCEKYSVQRHKLEKALQQVWPQITYRSKLQQRCWWWQHKIRPTLKGFMVAHWLSFCYTCWTLHILPSCTLCPQKDSKIFTVSAPSCVCRQMLTIFIIKTIGFEINNVCFIFCEWLFFRNCSGSYFEATVLTQRITRFL